MKITSINSTAYKSRINKAMTPASYYNNPLELAQAQEKFKSMGVKSRLLNDLTLALDSYTPDKSTIKKIDFDENEIFKYVSQIDTYADFSFSKLKSTYNLKSIGKSCIFSHSQIEETPKLEYIGKDVYYGFSKLKDTGNIVIGRDMHIENSNIQNDLKAIVGRKIYR